MNMNNENDCGADKNASRRKTEANELIGLLIGSVHEQSRRKNEQYFTGDIEFRLATDHARERLGFRNLSAIDEDHLEEWVVKQLSKGEINLSVQDDYYNNCLKRFYAEVENVISELSLSSDWTTYIAIYIVNKMPPKAQAFRGPGTIEIENVAESGELVIRLKPGLRRDDYITAWQVFRNLLGPSERLSKPFTNAKINAEIIEAHSTDWQSYGQIAKRFFPDQDQAMARQRVIKVVTRELRRKEKWTKPTE